MLADLPDSVVLKALLDALEQAGIGCTVVVDRGGELERAYSNRAVSRIFGVEPETMANMPPMGFLAPAERERLAAVRGSLEAGTSGKLSIATSIVRSDGATVPVEVGLAYVPLGDARATFVFMQDVSAKAEVEAALRESEARFRAVAEASPDSITLFSEGRYLYANPVALRHLGLSSLADLAAVDPWARVPADRREEVLDRYERLSRGERVPPLEWRFPGPGGKEIVLEASLTVASVGGAPAVLSFTRDITERVWLQAKLMQDDRLASLGILAAGVAHELNNPLTSLGMQIRRLSESPGLTEDLRLAVAQMDDAAARMKTIIGDLLFMARPTEQPQAHVDVAQVLSSTIALLRAGMPASPSVDVELSALPAISGYASKLGQVLLNVLRNAAQAVEGQDGGVIRVRARSLERGIEIAVSDNGPGIASDLLPRVAQPFFTTKPQGTGLGLWISQTLVEQHGGTLEIASATGGGTTVTITLPA